MNHPSENDNNPESPSALQQPEVRGFSAPADADDLNRAAIALRAYYLWLDDGRPDDSADRHWLQAEQETLTAQQTSSGPFGVPVGTSLARAAVK